MPSDLAKPQQQCMGGHPQPPTEPLPCPRCDSTKTKFCYYNNYNLSQPRHFCKSCRRYWTQGGTLRDVPVGGGYRKNSKRSRSSSSPPDTSSSSSSSSTATATERLPEKPISALAGVNLDSTDNHLNLFETMNNGPRSFTSLLNFQNSGLLSLAGYDEMGYGFGKGAWSYPEVSDDFVGGYGGIREWHLNGSEAGEVEDECLAWPELAIATQSKSFK